MASTSTGPSSPKTGTVSVKDMIQIGESLTSNVDGYEDYGLLYSMDFKLDRLIGTGAGGQLDTSAQIRSTPLVIKIASGVYIPDMETNFIKGTPFEKIVIAKLANVNGTNQLSEQYTFENAYILKMQPSNDPSTKMEYFTLTLRYSIYTDTNYSYDDVSGALEGQNEVSYDFSKNVASNA